MCMYEKLFFHSGPLFFCYYLCFLCSEFRLQSLNSVTKPEHIQRGRNAGRRYKVTAEITSATPRRMHSRLGEYPGLFTSTSVNNYSLFTFSIHV